MKKNILNNIEAIKKKRDLSKETKKQISKKIIANALICIGMLLLLMIYRITADFLTIEIAISMYHTSAMLILLIALAILEIAYKKDNGNSGISGLEILALAIFTLFAPYIYIKFRTNFIYKALIFITVYYISKIMIIYYKEKKQYSLNISDISNIIKKESQDEMAQQEKNKIKENHKQRKTNKRDRPRKKK